MSLLRSLHYQDYTASSATSSVETDAKSAVIPHFSKFLSEEETVGFEVKHEAVFLYALTTFT